MAVPHFSVSIVARGSGRSAVLSAAYRHCAKMDFEREARTIDDSRKQGLLHEEFAIPADAPNPLAAEAFIDFLLRPEVMAAISSKVRYANAVPESRPMIAAPVRDDPNVYPPDAALAGAFVPGTLPATAERARSRMWSRFKAGGR